MSGNKVIKNAKWIIICKVFQAVLGVVISSLTARYLGDSSFGVINYAASIVTFVVPIMQLGFTNVLVQETINNPDEEGKIYGTVILLSFINSLVCILGIVGIVSLINAGEKEKIMVCGLYGLMLIPQALEMIQYWFQAKYISKYTSVIALIAYAIITCYKIFLLATKKTVYWFSVSHALDYLIIAIVLLILYKRFGGQKLSFSLRVARRIFARSKHYIVSGLMVTIFAQTDKIMINLMMDDAATGWYSAAVSCAGITSFLFVAIIDAVRPWVFEQLKVGEREFEKSVVLLYSIIIYLALAQSVFMTLFAKLIVLILYGNQFLHSINALKIIVWYTTFSYMGAVRNVWILAQNKQKFLWVINLSGAIFNIILNFTFIPLWGINGAAVASLLTQIFTNFLIGFIIQPIRSNNKLMIKALNPLVLIRAIKGLKHSNNQNI